MITSFYIYIYTILSNSCHRYKFRCLNCRRMSDVLCSSKEQVLIHESTAILLQVLRWLGKGLQRKTQKGPTQVNNLLNLVEAQWLRKLGLQANATLWFRALSCYGPCIWCAETSGWQHDARRTQLLQGKKLP